MEKLLSTSAAVRRVAIERQSQERSNVKPRNGPLDGVRILELGHFVAAPFTTRLLADLGAEVIKVEEPSSGDPLRHFGAHVGGHPLWWSTVARNKKLITLDLRQADGQNMVRKLVSHCDVVVENFRAGQLERWNLGPESLKNINPRIIVNRISGFGQTGPYKDYLSLATIGEAMGGLRFLTGDAAELHHPPVRASLSLGDSLAGLYGALGVLAALWERDGFGSGKGRVIDTAMYEAVFGMLESSISEYGATGKIRESCGTGHPTISPSDIYPCADDKWICLAASGDVLFARLARLIGRAEIAEDARFAKNDGRVANKVLLNSIIEEWSRQFPAARCEAMLQAASIPAGRILSVSDCAIDPHYSERNAIVTVEVPGVGPLLHPGVVPVFDNEGAVPSVRWAGGSLGEHNDYVYREVLGLSEDILRELRRNKVL